MQLQDEGNESAAAARPATQPTDDRTDRPARSAPYSYLAARSAGVTHPGRYTHEREHHAVAELGVRVSLRWLLAQAAKQLDL